MYNVCKIPNFLKDHTYVITAHVVDQQSTLHMLTLAHPLPTLAHSLAARVPCSRLKVMIVIYLSAFFYYINNFSINYYLCTISGTCIPPYKKITDSDDTSPTDQGKHLHHYISFFNHNQTSYLVMCFEFQKCTIRLQNLMSLQAKNEDQMVMIFLNIYKL